MRTNTFLTLALGTAVAAQGSLCSQTNVSIPMVGCKSDGQVGPVEAPANGKASVAIDPAIAASLAYYRSEQGIRVLAPRGWNCFGTYGSGGEALFVSPQRLDSTLVLSSGWAGLPDSTIQLSRRYGDTSGRFDVAEMIARVFPDYHTFLANLLSGSGQSASSFPSGPYPRDTLRYRSKSVVEYETPPHTDGLGTHSRLRKNDRPVSGVVMLVGATPDLLQLSVRLPTSLSQLAPAIIQEVEREATKMGSRRD